MTDAADALLQNQQSQRSAGIFFFHLIAKLLNKTLASFRGHNDVPNALVGEKLLKFTKEFWVGRESFIPLTAFEVLRR